MKHTELPFNFDITLDGFIVYKENTMKSICKVIYKDVSYMPSKEEAEANSEFIVKACNNHYKLIEALKLCSKALDKYPSIIDIDFDIAFENANKLIKELE